MGFFSRRGYDNETTADPNNYSSNHVSNYDAVTGHHGMNTNYNNNPATGTTGASNNFDNTGRGHTMADSNNNNYYYYNNNGPGHTMDGDNFNNDGRGRAMDDNNYDNDGRGHAMGYNNNNNNNNSNGHDYNDHNYNEKRGRTGGLFGRGRGWHGHHAEKKREKRQRRAFDIDSGEYNTRPSFGQWLKMTWLDILTMVIMGAIGLGVYEARPAPSRSFPLTFLDGSVVYPEFAYPLRKEIVPIWAAALLGSLVPIFFILLMQIRIRSFWDVNNAITGLLYSLISAAVFQVFLKWLIGGLRPHFLDVCDPDPNLTSGTGFKTIMFDRTVCRGDVDQIDDSLESFPSGHSTAAWAGFLFLYYYLNAKLKVFSNYHPAMWKIIALYAPLLAATLITGALTIDEFHNWYDCLAGAIIGSVMATSAYRMVYASIWDFRFNHIPLTRHTPFSYGAGPAGAGGFESAIFTRQAGWGFEEAYGGAPFDAAHGLRGQQAGFNNAAQSRHHGGGMMGQKRSGDIEHNATTTSYDNNGVAVNGTGHNHHDKSHNTGSQGDTVSRTMPRHTGRHDNVDRRDENYVNNGTNLHGGDENFNDGANRHRGDDNYVNDGQNRNSYGNDPTMRDGRYHHHSRSLERKRLPNPPSESDTPMPRGGY